MTQSSPQLGRGKGKGFAVLLNSFGCTYIGGVRSAEEMGLHPEGFSVGEAQGWGAIWTRGGTAG